jgi:hypothetical protein
MQPESANETTRDNRGAGGRRSNSNGLSCRALDYERSGNVIAKALPSARHDGDQETYQIDADSVDQPEQIANERLSQTDGTPIHAPNANVHQPFTQSGPE